MRFQLKMRHFVGHPSGYFAPGSMDDFRIYSRALTEEEILIFARRGLCGRELLPMEDHWCPVICRTTTTVYCLEYPEICSSHA
jgi:hypothetical protein